MIERFKYFFSYSISWVRKRENLPVFLFFVTILSVFFINTFHEQYPDEYDNLLGGWYFIHGLPIYTTWFTHHGPGGYVLAAIIELFTRNSFVAFRIVYSFVLFTFTLYTSMYLRRKFGERLTRFYLLFIFFLALMGNYYWLHMLLADSISAYLFAPIFALLLLATLYKKALTKKDMIFISLLTSLSLLSSLTYTYVSGIIYLYSFFYYLYTNRVRIFSIHSLQVVAIFAVPFLIFLAYLLATFSIKEYWYDAITFNQKFYIYNYPREPGTTFINPIRYAVVIANNFYNNYLGILHQVPSWNVGFPLNITMGVGSLGLLIYLLIRRYYLFSLVSLGLFIYSNARSNPLTSGERDYQSAVYIVFSFLAISFLLSRMPLLIEETKHYGEKIALTILIAVIGIYSFFSAGFLFQKFFNRSYTKYMGTMSLIYDRPHIAPIINNLIKPDDPIWIGPLEFEELFYTHGKPASKYQILLPGIGKSPQMQQALLADLDRTRPEIIWLNKRYFILGSSPEKYGQFFLSYLNDHYITVGEYKGQSGEKYKTLVPVDEWVDLETRLYMRKDVASSIINRLLDHNYIVAKEKGK